MKPQVEALHALFEDEWEWTLREFPTIATIVGDPRYNDRWPDMSPAAHERRAEHARDLLRRIDAIDRSRLSDGERLNFDLFRREAALEVEGQRFHAEYMPITQMNGVQQDVADYLQASPRRTARQFDDVVARLRRVGELVDQNIALMRRGLEMELTPPRVIMAKVPEVLARQIVERPEESPIARLLLDDLPFPDGSGERETIGREVLTAIREVVVPAYRRLGAYLEREYLPATRTTIGLGGLPDGEAWYAHQIRVMTTLDRTAAEIHQLGLDEVGRIRSEMETTMGHAGHRGSIASFFEFLRRDPQFFFRDKRDLLMTYRDIAKRLDAELPKLFKTLPRLPYGVIPVPAYSEKVQTTAYYLPGAIDSGRPGYFFANTYDLASRPRWEMEALTAHEAVPGHHLQIALAQELQDLPRFRRHGGHTAFVEGWGLYAESLGEELGLYQDRYSKFGQLTYEMWRAIRLVVDTGLHAFGWTRERAITYFEENAGKAGHDIEVEVDRYIAWPGQALAYKIGELTIKDLRAGASRTLGDRFDIREFHDVVLLAGSLPLPILEERVRHWVAAELSRSAAGAGSGSRRD